MKPVQVYIILRVADAASAMTIYIKFLVTLIDCSDPSARENTVAHLKSSTAKAQT